MRLTSMRFVLLSAFAILAATASRAEERRLYVYTWADYFDSEVIARFEEEHNCSVILSFFDSNENLNHNLETDGASFDVLTPSSYMSRILHEAGFLAPLDHSLLPNIRNLAPDAIDIEADPEMRFSVPYARTVTGVGYNRAALSGDSGESWDIFARTGAGASGRTAFLTDMRECLGAALKYLGHSLNSTNPEEIAAAGEVLRNWRGDGAVFDVEEAKNGLMTGKYAFVQNYNGDILQAMHENPGLGFFIPREGAAITTDDLAISAESPVKDLAHAFINHMLDPEMALLNMRTILYYMPNGPALAKLSPEIRYSPAFAIDKDVLEKCEIIRAVGPAREIYETVWREVVGEEVEGEELTAKN